MKTRLIKSPPGTVTGYKMPGKKTLIRRSTFGESSLSFYVTCTAASPDVLADVPCKNHFKDPLSLDILLVFTWPAQQPVLISWPMCPVKTILKIHYQRIFF
jgi:hypothetical protein